MAVKKTLVGRVERDVLRFTAGRDRELDLALVEADCIGSAAHATMLSRMRVTPGILSARDTAKLIAELVVLIREARQGSFRISERDQDVHLAVERRLTRRLGELGRKIHTGRSRNDQVAVDLRLYAKQELFGMIEEACVLAGALLAFARKHRGVPMVGRTHMQPAMPGSVGLWAGAHAESLADDLSWLRAAYDGNNRCPLGSAAGYGVPLPVDRALTARLLGFEAPIHNVLYAANARGKCEAGILAAVSQVMLTLSRMAEDLILYSTPEFGYFRLPAAFCTGSSMMPQKRNPDVLELVRARAARLMGDAWTAAAVVRSLPSGYHRDLQETKEPLLAGLRTGRECLRITAALVPKVAVDRQALRAGFRPEVFATDRALARVRQGVPFRDAYEEVREQPDEEGGIDPGAALAARTHLGAPGRLDLAAVRSRVRDAAGFVRRERRRYHAAVSRLLGVHYPGLTRETRSRGRRQAG